MSATFLLRLHGQSLRLDRDPERHRPALAHLHGYALSHGGPASEEIRALGKEFKSIDAANAMSATSAERALDALRQRGALLLRSFDRVPAVPRWSESYRIGTSKLLPFDPEVVGLRLGTRRLAKRDHLDESTASAVEDWWRSQGLATRRVGHTVLAALTGFVLDHAEPWQRSLTDPAKEAEASAALGDALGYPSCCVESYLRLSGNDDVALASALLPALPSEPADPLALWLHAPLALVSHAPCSLECRPTIELASGLLEALEQTSPGFARRWGQLARRIHAFDIEGGVWSFEVKDERVGAASRLDGLTFRDHAEHVGKSARMSSSGLEIEMNGVSEKHLDFGFMVDHRGDA